LPSVSIPSLLITICTQTLFVKVSRSSQSVSECNVDTQDRKEDRPLSLPLSSSLYLSLYLSLVLSPIGNRFTQHTQSASRQKDHEISIPLFVPSPTLFSPLPLPLPFLVLWRSLSVCLLVSVCVNTIDRRLHKAKRVFTVAFFFSDGL
jgi:hypothetical protein